MASAKPIDQVIAERVLSRKQELIKIDPDELRQLPSYTNEQFSAYGKPLDLGIWHEEISSGGHLFVVQCTRHVFLGFGYMFAEGFLLDSSGAIRDADEKFMWDSR
jgi:hypothetical protein